MSPRQASSLTAALLVFAARAALAQPADPAAPPPGGPAPALTAPPHAPPVAAPPLYPYPYGAPPHAPPPYVITPPTYAPPPLALGPQAPRGPRWASTDPLLPVGIAVTAGGVAFAIPGFFALGAMEGQTVCGLNGCVGSTDFTARATAGGALGASAAMLLVGVPTIVAGASGEVPEAGARRSPRMAMFGAWLTGFGAGAAGYGLGTLAGAGRGRGVEGVGVALGVGVTGLVMIAAGVPMWAVGTRPVDPADQTAALSRPARAEARMNVGMTLSSLGVVMVPLGIMMIGNLAAQSGDFAGLAALVIGGPVVGAGTILLGVGLPLWLTGSGPLTTSSLLPSVAAGPTSIQLTWRY